MAAITTFIFASLGKIYNNIEDSESPFAGKNAIRFSTLEAICEALHCQPGDILEYDPTAGSDAEEKIADEVNSSKAVFLRVPLRYAGGSKQFFAYLKVIQPR